MATVPMEHGLLIAAVLFCLGLIGVLARRNLIFMLMSVEIMLNAAGLAFVMAGSRWQQPDGQTGLAKILELTDEKVVVDTNHPMAGKKLLFEIKLLKIE